MNVGVFTCLDLTKSSGPTTRVVNLTKWLPSPSCDVTLFSQGDMPKELKGRVKHISYNRSRILAYSSLFSSYNKLLSPLRYISVRQPLTKQLIAEDYDILHCHQHGPTNIALSARKDIKRPIIFEMHGIIASESEYNKIYSIKDRFFQPLLIKMEKKVIEKSSGIIVLSQKMKEYVTSNFDVGPNNIYPIPPGVDVDVFKNVDKEAKEMLEAELKLNDKIKILYAGGFSGQYGILDLVKAIEIISQKRKDIVLILLGDGLTLPSIRDYAQKNHLRNVIFKGRVPFLEVPKYLSIADILAIPHKKTRQVESVYPIKLFEYLASGKPIVITKFKILEEIITANKTGVFVEPNDPKSIANGILRLIEDDTLRRQISKNGQKLVENFTWEKAAERTKKVYKNIIMEGVK